MRRVQVLTRDPRHENDDFMRFDAVAKQHLPLLHSWLAQPHVTTWWEAAPTWDELQADYLPRLHAHDVAALDAPGGVVQYIAVDDDVAVGYVQAYRMMAHQHDGWWLDENDPCALGLDAFVGVADRIGQGVGTRMLRAFVEFLLKDARVTSIQADPDPANVHAIAAYRKAGFTGSALVTTPDGPALLLRLQRR
jgi:RimJ/RimL family protein N-acetyltransferase